MYQKSYFFVFLIGWIISQEPGSENVNENNNNDYRAFCYIQKIDPATQKPYERGGKGNY